MVEPAMNKTEHTPLWVYLAFSNISTRKGALLLILASAVFTGYCVPWSLFFAGPGWLAKIFLADDWSWFAAMVPVTFWYWLSLRWIDNNHAWVDTR